MQLKQRIEDRHKVLIRCRLHGSGFDKDACILDASSRGVLLTLARPPKYGEMIEIYVNGHALLGSVEWTNGRRMGMKLHERINVLAFITGESGSLALKRGAYGKVKRSAAMQYDWNQVLARQGQFAAMLGAIGVAGYFLVSYLTQGLGSLGDVSELLARH